MSKSEFISKCKESDKDTQDMCYGMGAFYYRDESFCKLVEGVETKKNCTKENIEQWYGSVNSGGMSGLPGMGGLPGGGIISPNGEENPESSIIEEPEETRDFYGSAKEIAAPSAIATELKSILGEACGGVKLIQLLRNPMDFTSKEGDILVYVWKNEPTEEKLISAFEKEGYEIELPGSPLFAKRDNLTVVVSWAEEMDSQEIGVMFVKEE